MTPITRREWHRLTTGSLLAATIGGRVGAQSSRGVTVGVQSYSFRDLSLTAAIEGMRAVGLRSCELWQGHVEPKGVSRDEMRRWRETVSLDEFRKTKALFDGAGIALSAYNISFRDDFSEAEIDRGFEMAKALGAPVITASSNVATARGIAPVAARHKMRVGMHNHSKIDPNEFATPDSLVNAMKAGPFIVINLDIGHFTAADFDAVAFLREHHAQIVTLHIKDRKKAQGPNVVFGEGDTPIGPVLRLLRDQKWAIPANIEYEYSGSDTVAEVKRCFEYCKRQLDG
jgi:sugar phosphate isomerase/epimerase